MNPLLDFLTANAGLLCFGAAAILAMIMVAITAYRRGHEDCCRAFAQHALDETRHQTSVRI